MAVVAAEMLVVHVGMPYGLVCSVLQKERQRYIKPMCASTMGSRSRVGLMLVEVSESTAPLYS